MIWSSPTLQGSIPDRVFGFGLVTISPTLGKLTPPAGTPAWIGFAWGGEVACPAILSPSPAARLASSGYKAVIIGTRDGFPALAYSARTSFCTGPPKGPSLVAATHVVSIQWQSLGIQGTRMNLRYFLPDCGRFFMIQGSGTATSETIEVDAVVPDVPMPCTMTGWVHTSMQLDNSTVLHAETGTVRMIQP